VQRVSGDVSIWSGHVALTTVYTVAMTVAVSVGVNRGVGEAAIAHRPVTHRGSIPQWEGGEFGPVGLLRNRRGCSVGL